MAHITYTLAPHFTGHVGPVRFVNGHGTSDDPEVVAFFQAQPDLYAVEPDPKRPKRKPPVGDPDPED